MQHSACSCFSTHAASRGRMARLLSLHVGKGPLNVLSYTGFNFIDAPARSESSRELELGDDY